MNKYIAYTKNWFHKQTPSKKPDKNCRQTKKEMDNTQQYIEFVFGSGKIEATVALRRKDSQQIN